VRSVSAFVCIVCEKGMPADLKDRVAKLPAGWTQPTDIHIIDIQSLSEFLKEGQLDSSEYYRWTLRAIGEALQFPDNAPRGE